MQGISKYCDVKVLEWMCLNLRFIGLISLDFYIPKKRQRWKNHGEKKKKKTFLLMSYHIDLVVINEASFPITKESGNDGTA